MSKKYVLVIVICVLTLPSHASAQVVINEIYPNPPGPSTELSEYVELYNSSSESKNLESYTLEDKVGKKYTITSLTLDPKSYHVFTKEATSLALNNSNESIFLKDSTGTIIDSYSYETTIEGKSFSRIPDGNGSFQSNTEPSPKSINFPAPTSIPEQTPTQVATPFPTSLPTQTPTIAPTYMDIESTEILPTEKVLSDTKATVNSFPNEIEISPFDEKDIVDSKNTNYLPVILIGLGASFLSGAAIHFFINSKKGGTIRFERKDDEK